MVLMIGHSRLPDFGGLRSARKLTSNRKAPQLYSRKVIFLHGCGWTLNSKVQNEVSAKGHAGP